MRIGALRRIESLNCSKDPPSRSPPDLPAAIKGPVFEQQRFWILRSAPHSVEYLGFGAEHGPHNFQAARPSNPSTKTLPALRAPKRAMARVEISSSGLAFGAIRSRWGEATVFWKAWPGPETGPETGPKTGLKAAQKIAPKNSPPHERPMLRYPQRPSLKAPGPSNFDQAQHSTPSSCPTPRHSAGASSPELGSPDFGPRLPQRNP